MDKDSLGKIDVHHHSFPSVYSEYLDHKGRNPAGWVTQPWTAELDCEFCESTGVGTAILSCVPGGPSTETHLEQAQHFTRECNKSNAQLRDALPQKYGFFAHVSNLCNTELALEEISYAFDILRADGVALGTSYQMGGETYYLGHTDFIPIWDALNTRKAVVFVHPVPSADRTVVNKNLPMPAYDFPHETGRTAIDMITNPSKMVQQHAADCKIILSHAGGDLPFLIDRTAGLLAKGPKALRLESSKDEILDDARRFYYDTALSSSPMHLSALFELLGPDKWDHLLFGTDFPPGGSEAIADFTHQLERSKHVNIDNLRSNALKLFPRLMPQGLS